MVTILCALVSIFEFRVRSRASLELELIALRHQVTVLRRQHRGRPQLSSIDRLLWVWLYRIWPQVIDAMVLVKPATVVQWHRKVALLAVAITPSSGTTQDRHRNP
jgi:putative transposase